MKLNLLLLFFIINTSLSAQILNVENLRVDSDTTGFSGGAELNINFIKNTRNIFTLNTSLFAQYQNKKHLYLLIGNVDFKTIDEEDIINKGTFHLRYNYETGPVLILEAFIQAHSDAISNIDERHLVGAGPRFRLVDKPKKKLFLGTLLMYEYEKERGDITPRYHNDVRFSGYLTFDYHFLSILSFKTTTFYQPVVNELNDYRLNTYNTFSVEIIKNLQLNISYILQFDTRPVEGIPTTQFQLLNGISYTFK
ncbi:DUF481 domain-containing protein [Formosa haliotis]|uniref:DUF481 domain-containing protein n=1 Tax=Formosa haliotis TaxID=1555194 RepID=UPI000825665B|nr:DUF481 domain-containing protein [Formosa haliotis]